MAKRNCFGWYILGQLDSDAEAIPRVHSVDIGTVSASEDIRKLVYQDFLESDGRNFVPAVKMLCARTSL